MKDRIKPVVFSLLVFFACYLFGAGYSLYKYPNQVFTEGWKEHLEITGKAWKFHHLNDLVDADFRKVVRPSLDFVYSSAVLDTREGAHVLSIPKIDRYFVFQFMEDDTDVFDYVGSRNYGKNKELDVLIVSHDYTGSAYGLPMVKLKTDHAWLLVRYQLFHRADLENVQNIQRAVKLIPVAQFLEDMSSKLNQ